MYFKIVCVLFFVCTNYSTNCIDLDKYEVNNEHVPELPEYYDWEPIPTAAFEKEFSESGSESENTPSFNETSENEHREDDEVTLEDSKEDEEGDVVLEDDKEEERDDNDDDIPEDVYFAGPVKAKGKVTVGANFGYGSSYPTFPYPWFPPYFYNPFYPPYPNFFPYSDPSIFYDEDFARKYYGMTSNKQNEKSEDNQPEGEKSKKEHKNSEESIDVPYSDKGGNEAAGKMFGGFVPASGNVKIFAQF